MPFYSLTLSQDWTPTFDSIILFSLFSLESIAMTAWWFSVSLSARPRLIKCHQFHPKSQKYYNVQLALPFVSFAF